MTDLHTDRAGLAAPVSGTLYEGRAARTHGVDDPLQYASGPEHRDMDELRAIAAQLPGKLLTLDHPDGLLRDGAQGVVIGQVVAARVDVDHVVASFMVYDQRGLDAIAAGTHELSLGYGCTLDAERYQRGISIDHLAVVPRARCGPTCALRADGEGATCPCQSAMSSGEPEVIESEKPDIRHETCACKNDAVFSLDMSDADKTKLDEANAALDAARNDLTVVKTQLDTANAALEAAKTEIATLKSQPDVTAALANLDAAKTKAEIDAANATAALAAAVARADAAEAALAAAQESARKDADDAFNARVDARVELLAAATSVGVENAKTMSDRDIKVAVIKHVDGTDVAAEKSMDFVDGVYSGALDRHAKSAGSRNDARVVIQQMRNDGAALPNTSADDEKAARAAAANRTSAAWMTPSDKRN